jgi:hypothetical protein
LRPGDPGVVADQLASIRLEAETDPVVVEIELSVDLMRDSVVLGLRIR